MINAKEINSSKELSKLIKKYHKYIDIVRSAIDPIKISKFLKILNPVKRKYKKISFNINLMYLSKWYFETKFVNKILNKLSNKCDAVAFVDSYGALKPLEVYNFFKSLNKYKSLKIGCHFHNNCGLALANTLSAIKGRVPYSRYHCKRNGQRSRQCRNRIIASYFLKQKI